MSLTLTAGPGGGHSLVDGTCRTVPVGTGDAQSKIEGILITISQILKRPFIVSMGAWGQIRSPRRALHSPITGDWFSSAAPTKG